ncbi:unnamed protein product, partial [Rotaria sp. Silwood2]
RAWNTNPSGATASILIHQRFSWRRDYWGTSSVCTNQTIAQQWLVGSGTGSLTCVAGGALTNETVIAQVNCANKTIIDFTTSSPIGMKKTAITKIGTNLYSINLIWTPTSDQYGPQGFCAGAVDSTDVQSDPWCITFLVGFTAPNLQTPLLVQGSASPIGTVFANQTIFSIQ